MDIYINSLAHLYLRLIQRTGMAGSGQVRLLSLFFPNLEFPYMIVRFLIHSSLVKSDNEIGKFSY